jgi:hypothetical protein
MSTPEVPESDEFPAVPIDDERVQQRQALTAEEQAAGSDDPAAQAQAILVESEERTLDPGGDHGSFDEHRHSEDTV